MEGCELARVKPYWPTAPHTQFIMKIPENYMFATVATIQGV